MPFQEHLGERVEKGAGKINRKNLLIFTAMFLWIILVMLPILPLPMYAIMTGGWPWPNLLPQAVSFRTFLKVIGPGTTDALLRSILVALCCVLLNALIAFPAADALGRRKIPFKKSIEAFLILPAIVPPLMVAMGLYRNFLYMGLTETFGGVVIMHMIPTLPYMIRALTEAYTHFGQAYEEQARMLGAGPVKRFYYITLPYMLPALGAGASLTVLISMAQYATTFLIGGGSFQTLTLRMMPYLSGGNLTMGAMYTLIFAATAGILLFAITRFVNRTYKV